MKKLLACLAPAILTPTTALAIGIDVSWNDCAIGNGAANKDFNCTQTPTTANQNYNLHFQIKPGQDLPDFVAVECYADIGVQGPIGNTSSSPNAFWQFQQGGCAVGGVTAFDVMPASCVGNGYADFADGDGSGALESFAYREDWNGAGPQPGRGHFVVIDARDASMPQAITAGTNYWAIELRFNNRRRATCQGCNVQAVFSFNQAILRGASGAFITAEFPDKGSNCATINGAFNNCNVVDPVEATTWGRIKTLYRR